MCLSLQIEEMIPVPSSANGSRTSGKKNRRSSYLLVPIIPLFVHRVCVFTTATAIMPLLMTEHALFFHSAARQAWRWLVPGCSVREASDSSASEGGGGGVAGGGAAAAVL